MIAALYIDERGPYPKIVGVQAWGETLDARKYEGPFPVVAHPPCGPWGRLRHMYRGAEHDCAPRAVAQVHAYGGVLEHPANSLLWDACGLPKPGQWNDYRGFTVEVCQVEWGHVARKRTWLYIVGVAPSRVQALIDARPFPGREPTHWISGGRGREGKKRNTTPVPPGIKVCSAQQRRRTPPAFAEFLITLARESRVPAERVSA